MGKNKLHMIGKKTKHKKRTKRRSKKKLKIIDVPLSKKQSKGSKESLGSINYHYQKYYNTFAFLKKIITKNKILHKRTCIPDVGKGWMKSFLKLHFFKDIPAINSIMSLKPVDSTQSLHKFITEVDKCMKQHRLVPINLEIIVPDVGTHANIILIDTHKKTVELFEPHGKRDNKSQLEDISRAYYKVSKNVQRFFSRYLPDYTYIAPSEYEPGEGLQARLDAFSGLCVTWSILYLHYRVLNPDISQKDLLIHLDSKITKSILLRYTKYVEETLKNI
jgi:hypothetical protein